MKKMILALGLIVTLGISSAFTAEPKVSPKTLEAFKNEFAAAKEVSWAVSSNYYRAAFTINDQKIFAFYSMDGELLNMGRYISSLQLIKLVGMERREFVLRGVLEKIRDEYDYIFIDCLPSLGLVTVNSLVAADSVLIPVQCEVFSLEGLVKLKNTINLVKKNLNPKLEVEGLLLSMYDSRLRLANLVVDKVREHAKDYVFETIIHRSARLAEAPNAHKPVITYDAASKGSINFLNLCKEFLIKNQDKIQRG